MTYQRPKKKHGLSVAERVERYSHPVGDCREWMAAKDPRGYGRIRIDGKTRFAHRAAWESAHGQIPAGKEVCHRCDNPACVLVDHLFLGTHSENMLDMARKLRSGARKLEPDAVRAIRASTETNVSLAGKYGVTDVMVSIIRRGKAWGYVYG